MTLYKDICDLLQEENLFIDVIKTAFDIGKTEATFSFILDWEKIFRPKWDEMSLNEYWNYIPGSLKYQMNENAKTITDIKSNFFVYS